MRIRSFRAPDMKQALRRVEESLGPRAVILRSRSLRSKTGFLGLVRRRVVEVTAGIEDRSEGHGIVLDAAGPGSEGHPEPARRARPVAAGASSVPPESYPSELREDLNRIRSLLGTLVREGRVPADERGAAAQQLLHLLDERGVDDALARSLVQRVLAGVDPLAAGDLDRLKLRLAAEMREDVRSARRGRPPARVQVFAGPSGVGKTTTLAKLAVRSARSAPGGVRVVTTDADGTRTLEALLSPSRASGVHVARVTDVEGLRRVLATASGTERLFIDTRGTSHRDPATFGRLQALVDAVPESELLLCLSAGTRSCDAREILGAYASVPWSRLVFTKLDETRVYGELYNCIVRSGRPIACVTTGQVVPDDIESIDLPGLLRRVLQG